MARNLTNGGSDSLDAGTSSLYQMTPLISTGFTVSAWAKPSATSLNASSLYTIWEHGDFNGAEDYLLRFNGQGAAGTIAWGNSAGVTTWTYGGNITAGNWYQFTFTWSTGGTATLFFNGSSVSSGSKTWSANTGTHFYFGNATSAGGRQLSGSIADIAIWNAPLAQGEVTALANGARPGSIRQGSLIGWWPLDGQQSPEPELSGNAKNATVTGTTSTSGPPIMMLTPRWPRQLDAAAASSIVFRRSLSSLGTRVGSRQSAAT